MVADITLQNRNMYRRERLRDTLRYVLLLFGGAFILMGVGFYNGYALVYWDTGTYIYSGFQGFIPVDRPAGYGLFIKYFSLGRSIWYFLFVQNLLMSFTLIELCRLFFSQQRMAISFLLIVCVLSFFTGIGWNTNQLMPDLFAPMLFLLIFTALYSNQAGWLRIGIYSAIMILCCVSHFTHLLIGMAAVLCLFVYDVHRRFRFGHSQRMGRTVFVLAVLASGFLAVPAINYKLEKKFILSQGTHAFMIGHFLENGVLKEFLDQNCNRPDIARTTLCQNKDSLPGDLGTFLWEPKSIFVRSGGWSATRAEYEYVIGEIMGSPRYFLMNVKKTVIYGFVQLFRHDIGQGLQRYREGTVPYGQISWWFPQEKNNYLNSEQNSYDLDKILFPRLNVVNGFFNFLFVIATIILFFSGTWRLLPLLSRRLILFVIIGIMVNAFISAAFNSPNDRFQSRVIWMLPFAVMVVIASDWEVIRNVLFNSRNEH